MTTMMTGVWVDMGCTEHTSIPFSVNTAYEGLFGSEQLLRVWSLVKSPVGRRTSSLGATA